MQKQESAYIQKIHQEVLSQITKLMMSNDLTIEDIQTAVSSNSWKEKKAKREKVKTGQTLNQVTSSSSTVPSRTNPIISKV